MEKLDQRRALRILVDIPVVFESVGQAELTLHANLEPIYQRVQSAPPNRGHRMVGAVRDLSTNGAFIAGDPLPLMSRVALWFSIEGLGKVEALGWTLWRRVEDCEIPRKEGDPARLPRGFGILFEAIPLDARIAIHKMVNRAFTVSG